MAFEQLPIDSEDKNYFVGCELSGVLYRFRVLWNERGQFWTIGIFDSSDNPIVQGVKIVSDYPLFARFSNPLLPPGQIYCINTSDDKTEPNDSNLGTQFLIVYDAP